MAPVMIKRMQAARRKMVAIQSGVEVLKPSPVRGFIGIRVTIRRHSARQPCRTESAWCEGNRNVIVAAAFMADTSAVPDSSKQLIDMLRRSRLFRDYEHVFSEATGLALAIQAFGILAAWRITAKNIENPFCALLAERPATLAVCLKAHQDMIDHTGLTAAYRHLSLRFNRDRGANQARPSAPSATCVSARCFATCRRSPTRQRSAASWSDAESDLPVKFAKHGRKIR